MLNSVRARGHGSRPSKPEKGKKVKFRCETCQGPEAHRPCRIDVVWGSYLQNPHLMETGWAYRVELKGRFNITATDGKIHTLVLCPMSQAPSQDAAATPFRQNAIQQWKSRQFGARSILQSLEQSPEINFRLEDQTHWFDQDRKRVILSPSRVVEVVDTEGKRYDVPRPKSLAKHKFDAFNQWKAHLVDVSKRLMGKDVTEDFQLNMNPLWSSYDPEYKEQPVGSYTPLDEFDWGYDADPSQDLEEHVARINQDTQ